MEMMNELFEKYFRGETSLAEEKELKQYYSVGKVAPEHEIYRALFEVFNEEKTEKAVSPLKKVIPGQKIVKKIWFRTFAFTGIAATIALLLWVKFPQETDNYAIISGNRIENSEYAQQYAMKKLNHVNHMLAKSMKPMKSFNQVRQTMEPMQNLTDIWDKMDDIQNKLKFKKIRI